MRKGEKHTEETKKLISEKLKGGNHPFYNKKFSQEHLEKLKSSHKGIKQKEETKKKISETLKRKYKSGERVSSFKGKSAWNKGVSLSKEVKLKLSKERRGDKNPKWRGGLDKQALVVRKSYLYKEWRLNCFIRDGFICVYCGSKKRKELEVHHKESFLSLCREAQAYMPLFSLYDACMLFKPLWDLDNGITLCKECHLSLHRRKK